MSGIVYNGSTAVNIMINGVVPNVYYNGFKIWPEDEPYNPYNLPDNTVRVKVEPGWTPTWGYERTLVDANENIWDITYYLFAADDTEYMFNSNPTKLIEVLGVNLGTNTSTYRMFKDCTNLTSVSLFETRYITKMEEMFIGCTSLTSLPTFNTSNVTNMANMLRGCISLTSVPLFNTSNVTNMNGMLFNCNLLTSVPLFDTSNVISLASTFEYCSSLTTLPSFNTSKVTDMNYMCAHCSALTTLPTFNTSKVTDMRYMCVNCTSLTKVPLLNTSSLLNAIAMFANCYKVTSGAYALYNQMANQVNVPTHTQCFTNCGRDTTTGAAELAQIPTGWK